MAVFVEYLPAYGVKGSDDDTIFASELIQSGARSTYKPQSRMSVAVTADEHGYIAIASLVHGGPVVLSDPTHRLVANVTRRFEINKDEFITYLAITSVPDSNPPPTLTAPECTVAPAYIATGPAENQVITLADFTTGNWTGNPTPTFAYQLKVKGVDKTFPYTCLVDDTLVLAVTATNTVGTKTVASVPTGAATAAPTTGGGGGTTPTPSTAYATASNTGPWASALSSIPASYTVGDVTLSTVGQLYENKRINGTIRVMASNIKIRNCIIKGNGGYGILIDKSCDGVIVHNCEIFGDGVNDMAAGIGGCGHFENNNIHTFENGINVEGYKNTKIIRNYIHTPWSNPEGLHKDAIQIFGEDAANGGMGPVYVAANTVMMDNQTQSEVNGNIYVANTFGPCHDITVENNYVAGDAGYPMWYSGQGVSGAMTNVVFRNNYIGRGFYGYLYDVVGTAGADVTYTGNIETATPVPIASAPWIGTTVVSNNFPDPGAGTDTTAPTITSSASASVVSGNAFSRQLTANESVTWSIFGGADAAKFSLATDVLSMTAKNFASPTDSDANNTYIVIVRATDLAGNTTDQTITVTVTAAATSTSVWTDAFTPSAFEHNDSGGITISNGTSLYFTVTGSVKGIRFYWCNQNGNASPDGTVGLADAAGTILATKAYTGLTGSARWVEVDFDTPVVVQANKLYKPIMEQPRGTGTVKFHYPSVSTFGAAQQTSADGKIVVPANGAVVNGETYHNGLYDYSSTGLVAPTSTFGNEGYYTDLVFLPDA